MPLLSAGNLTMLDQAKRTDPNGKVMRIVELLTQTNEILADATWKEGNLPTGERTTVRTGLPTVYWRMINQGVPPSKSTTAQVDEMTGMLEAWCEVDEALAMIGNNLDSFRSSEAGAFLEAMNQEMAQTLLYGNAGNAPEEFTGLAPRYSSLAAGNGENIIDGGGTGSNNTSIWLVAWGDETVYGMFPQGSKAGLTHDDFGAETVEVTAGLAGSRMRAFRERYVWKAGLVVKDWRYVVRIANIDVPTLTGATPQDLISMMERADTLIPNRLGRRVFYVNRKVSAMLRKIARTAVSTGGGLTFENYAGQPIVTFGGIPVRTVDALLNTEARVV